MDVWRSYFFQWTKIGNLGDEVNQYVATEFETSLSMGQKVENEDEDDERENTYKIKDEFIDLNKFRSETE